MTTFPTALECERKIFANEINDLKQQHDTFYMNICM